MPENKGIVTEDQALRGEIPSPKAGEPHAQAVESSGSVDIRYVDRPEEDSRVRRLIDAVRILLDEERWGTWEYMEGSDIDDRAAAVLAAIADLRRSDA